MKAKWMRTSLQVALAVGMVLSFSFTANAKNYRAALWNSSKGLHGQYFVGVCEKIKNASNGEINFEVYEGGTLLPAKGVLPGLNKRVAEFALLTTAYIPSDFPYDNILLDLSFLSDDQMADAFASTEIKLTHPLILKEDARHKIVFNCQQSMGLYNYQCNSNVKTLADLKGKKIRTASKAHVDWASEVGAISVAVSASEIYTGLQRGSIDCTMGTPLFLTDFFKLIEVVKSVNLAPMGSTNSGGFYFNQDFWRSLDVKDRRMILDQSAEMFAEIMVRWGGRIDETFGQCREKGISLNEPDAELMAKLDAFKAKYLKDLPAMEMNDRKIPDPTQLIDDFLKSYAKWKKLLSTIDRTDLSQVMKLAKEELYDKIDASTYGM